MCAHRVQKFRPGELRTIPLEELAAEWLAVPEVKREYDALAPEFEALAKKLQARKRAAAKAPASRRILQPDGNPPPQRGRI
ncbi:MAG: hypothetical protein WAN35_11115 [Terracidiphilus sp.]